MLAAFGCGWVLVGEGVSLRCRPCWDFLPGPHSLCLLQTTPPRQMSGLRWALLGLGESKTVLMEVAEDHPPQGGCWEPGLGLLKPSWALCDTTCFQNQSVDLWRLRRQRQWANPLDAEGHCNVTQPGSSIFLCPFCLATNSGPASFGSTVHSLADLIKTL